VESHASGYYSVYSLKADALKELSRRLLSRETFSSLIEDVDLNAFDRKVLHDYLSPDERLKEIPVQRKKLEVILRYVSQDFRAGERYPGKKVNELLGHYHEDTTTLRRKLIGYKILGREKGEYWRIH